MDVPLPSEPSLVAVDLRVLHNENAELAPFQPVALEVVEHSRDAAVTVYDLPAIRSRVRAFISDNCRFRPTVSYVAARGKLIAELGTLSGQLVGFEELVARTAQALRRASQKELRGLDPKALAKQICVR